MFKAFLSDFIPLCSSEPDMFKIRDPFSLPFCTHPDLKAWVNIFITVVSCRKFRFRSVIALASAAQATVTLVLAWKVDFKLVL